MRNARPAEGPRSGTGGPRRAPGGGGLPMRRHRAPAAAVAPRYVAEVGLYARFPAHVQLPGHAVAHGRLLRSTPICTQRINRDDHSAQIKTTPSHKRYARPRQWPTGAPAPTEMAETLANSVVCPRRRANARQSLKPCSFFADASADIAEWSLRAYCLRSGGTTIYVAAASRFTPCVHIGVERSSFRKTPICSDRAQVRGRWSNW